MLMLHVVALFLSSPSLAAGSKIFVHPGLVPSHIFELTTIGEELVKQGHDVTIGLPTNLTAFSEKAQSKGIDVIEMGVMRKPFLDATYGLAIKGFKEGWTTSGLAFIWPKMLCDELDLILSDERIMSELRRQKFDLIVSDSPFFLRCYVILPHMLGVPFVTVSPITEFVLTGLPVLPSVLPMNTLPLTARMSFTQRLQNIAEILRLNAFDIPNDSQWMIEKHLPGVSKNFRQLASETEFWIFTTINPYLVPAYPLMPNMITIGGLNARPAEPLPEDLQDFCGTAEHGVVVMSLGSIPLDTEFIFGKFIDAFARLKQRVVMGVGDPQKIKKSDNVRAMQWIPQNDLLGHPNTVLFITHSGSNGQNEALYHGVPMIGIPVTPSDQKFNAKQTEFKGFGLALDLLSCTSDEIFIAINTILDDPSYKARISAASKAFRSDPYPPVQKAANWISFIAQHGGSHFRPAGLDMSVWEFYMLDIIGVMVLILHIVLLTVYIFCRKLIKTFFNSGIRVDAKKKMK